MNLIAVGVVVARRRLANRWADHAWLPRAVLPAVPPVEPWTTLSATAEEETFFAGAATIELHPGVTAHYGDNLTAADPRVWVMLRPAGDRVEVAQVTLDPYEGEAMAEGLDGIVETVPMAAELRARLARYYEAFHVERPFVKRKRDRVDGSTLRRRGGPPEEVS